MLVDGKWTQDRQPVPAKDDKGGFVRRVSSFRNGVTPDGRPGPTGTGGFEAGAGRYHLHAALIRPWAPRTLAGQALKGLEGAVSVSVVEPELTAQGWRFPEGGDPVTGATHLHEIYPAAAPAFTGRATVPVLYGKAGRTVVSNESADILRMLDGGLGDLASGPDLYPEHLRAGIDALNDRIYPRLKDGVSRAGFATTRAAYEEAFHDVFAPLDELEGRLSDGRRFLFGDRLTETDIRLFVTLIRFDAACHRLFKCNLRRIADYPRLQVHMLRVLGLPGVRGPASLDHITRGYYSTRALNPTGIVPKGPELERMAAGAPRPSPRLPPSPATASAQNRCAGAR